MFAIEQKQATQVDDTFAVQIKLLNGCTSGRSQADEFEIVGTPGKMREPIVISRVKERNHSPRSRINGVRFI